MQIVYRDLNPAAPASLSQVVFNDSPDPLALSYLSYSFHAHNLTALGNQVQLGGSARKLESCDVILVNWAKASEWPELAEVNPAGFIHPVTLSIYEVTSTNELVYRTGATQNILVPWRPLVKPDGTPYTSNGFAFRANIPFPNGITLPERVLVMVSYNTQFNGFAPTGSDGPFNSLNVAMKNTLNVAPVGSDVNPDVVLQIRNETWLYPSTGWTSTSVPMIRLHARSTETTTPPVNAGTWQATAKVANADYTGVASGTFTIQPATASVLLGDLIQVADGNPKSVTVTTVPPDLAVTTTYAGSSSPPTAKGQYAVHAEITNPNYQGIADQELFLGHNLNSWIDPWLANGLVSHTAVGSHDDPDRDSISNLMEYALALDPSLGNQGLPNQGLPRMEYSSGRISLVFRKNLDATDLNFQVEAADAELEGPNSWSPAVTTNEVIDTFGSIQTIRATLPLSPGDPRHFMRLKVTRKELN